MIIKKNFALEFLFVILLITICLTFNESANFNNNDIFHLSLHLLKKKNHKHNEGISKTLIVFCVWIISHTLCTTVV